MIKQRMNRATALIFAAALTGCASAPPKEGPFPDTIMPRCTMGIDCTAKWKAAKEYVQQNAQMAIINSNDQVIETDVPSVGNGPIAMRVTKELIGKGQYRLRAQAFCSSRKCLKEPWMVVAGFNLKVGAVTPTPVE